jgi:hypothetical protein
LCSHYTTPAGAPFILAQALRADGKALSHPYPYRWAWGYGQRVWALPDDREDRKGRPCRVVCRGSMNSALIEFEDGHGMVASRNGLRRRERAAA